MMRNSMKFYPNPSRNVGGVAFTRNRRTDGEDAANIRRLRRRVKKRTYQNSNNNID